MVKLIASDIDGTLMSYGETSLPPALFGLIRRLRAAGVLFCPASGRQYHSLRQLFAPVADEVCFLCENGAVVFGPGTEETAPVLSKTAMSRDEALSLARDRLPAGFLRPDLRPEHLLCLRLAGEADPGLPRLDRQPRPTAGLCRRHSGGHP